MIIVDDGSTDQTVAIARKGKAFFPKFVAYRVLEHCRNRGKGAAVRTAALASRGKWFLFMDADNATPFSQVACFEQAGEADVYVGSRALDRRRILIHQPFYREWMGRVFNLMVQTVAVQGIWDTQCGFKMFSREAVQKIFPYQRLEGFGFDVELLFLAKQRRLRILEVPVAWKHSEDSKVHPLRDAGRMALDLFRIRWFAWRGCYREHA